MAKRARAVDEFDSPWKDALQRLLQEFLTFFFPDISHDIDWARGYESLDKELQKIARRAKIGKRLADKLFKVWLKNGEERWLLIHIEVQNEYDKGFAERMFHYNVAAHQMYNTEVVSLAALCDDVTDWRPDRFAYGAWGCSTEVIFRITKILDFASEEAKLQTSENPFAAIALANCQAIQTRNDPARRMYWKLQFIRWLYRLKLGGEEISLLLYVIDCMMTLPEEFEKLFEAEVAELEEEMHVKYVSSWERNARKRGREEGIEEGIEKGIEKGLLEGIEAMLEMKFGDPGLALLPKARTLTGVESIRKFSKFLKKTQTLAEVRGYFD